jgi:hypothetical protein
MQNIKTKFLYFRNHRFASSDKQFIYMWIFLFDIKSRKIAGRVNLKYLNKYVIDIWLKIKLLELGFNLLPASGAVVCNIENIFVFG